MKKYFLLLVFLTIINVLVFFIPKIRIAINITDQNSSIVKAQESPFSFPEGDFKFSVPKQEKSEITPHCIVLRIYITIDSMIQDINIQYKSGYRLKGFSNSNSLFSDFENYIAVLCIDD